MSKAPRVLFTEVRARDAAIMLAADTGPRPTALPVPDPADPRFSAFFIDLDSNTQFYEAYGNSGRYMQLAMALIQGPAVAAWRQWAAREKKADGPARRAAFVKAAADEQTASMVREIDGLMLSLLRRHFPGPGGAEDIDVVPYLGAMEVFAKDELPVDLDRLQRVGGGGDDVSHHRMDGFGMWFHWTAVFDCVRFIPNGGEKPYRSLLLAGAAYGSAFDSAFRQRERTRPIYKNDEATSERLRKDVMKWIQDGEAASAQARELYRFFVKIP